MLDDDYYLNRGGHLESYPGLDLSVIADTLSSTASSLRRLKKLTEAVREANYRLLSSHEGVAWMLCSKGHRFEAPIDGPFTCGECKEAGSPRPKPFKAVAVQQDVTHLVDLADHNTPPLKLPNQRNVPNISNFCNRHGLRQPTDYTGGRKPATWVCSAHGHQFISSAEVIESRVHHRPTAVCLHCHILAQEAHGTVCTARPPVKTRTWVVVYGWRCGCGKDFTRSLREDKIVCARCR